MECLKVFCLVMYFVAVCSEKIRRSDRNKDNNVSHIEVMVRPLNKKIAKSEISQDQYTKHRYNKDSQVVNKTENKMTIVNGMFDLLQNIGINLSSKQSNKLHNFIQDPWNRRNTLFRILIYPKTSTQLPNTSALPDDILKNKPKATTSKDGSYYYGNDDECTRSITLLDAKEYKLKNDMLEKTLDSLPEVEHGSVQAGKSIHIKGDTQKLDAQSGKKTVT